LNRRHQRKWLLTGTAFAVGLALIASACGGGGKKSSTSSSGGTTSGGTASGKTYKFTLRPNLKYSSGKPVKASDFRCTIERDFQMDSPGVCFFGNIVGVGGSSGYATTKKGHIKGIVTNDASRSITI